MRQLQERSYGGVSRALRAACRAWPERHINSSEEELLDYYARLSPQHVTPALIGGSISIEPQGKACAAA